MVRACGAGPVLATATGRQDSIHWTSATTQTLLQQVRDSVGSVISPCGSVEVVWCCVRIQVGRKSGLTSHNKSVLTDDLLPPL